MSFFDALRYRFRAWFRPNRHDRDRDEEIRFHLSLESMQQEHRATGGLSASEAAAAARRRFGNVAYHTEEARTVSGLALAGQLAQDLRFALRSFRRTPSFTIVAVLTLAVGIGGNTAIYSAVDALLIRPLPFREPDRLLQISMTRPADGGQEPTERAVWSVPKFLVFEQGQRAFGSVALYTDDQITLRAAEGAERIAIEVTGARYHRTLGVDPILGRSFADTEDRPGSGASVVVLSYQFWQRKLGADPGVVGSTVNLAGTRYSVIGVMPEGFQGLTGRAEMWLPLGSQPAFLRDEAWSHSFEAVGRLAPEGTVALAIAEANRMGLEVDRVYPHPEQADLHWGATARPLDASRVDPIIRRSILILLAAVGLVLLIACANVANLFLVRAAGRRREIAVRLALGAGRRRLVRQLLTESLLLALLGGLAGLGVAWWGVKALAALNPADALQVQRLGGLGLVDFASIQLGPAAFGWAALLVGFTGVLFGLVPALKATRPSLADALRDGHGGRWRRLSAGSVLAVGELALAVVLLAGSGLMIRSLVKLLGVNPGFDSSQTLTLRLNPRDAVAGDSLPGFYDEVLERVRAVPGVVDAALIDCPPLNGGCNGTVAALRDRPAPPPGTEPNVGVHWISPNWPAAVRVPLRAGRFFQSSDRQGSRKVVLVSETAAQRLWPGEDPIGRPISVGQGGFWRDTASVVGVVGDVRFGTLDSPNEADVYLPYLQSPNSRLMLFVRSAKAPESLTRPVSAAVRAAAPTVPIYDVRTLAGRVARSATQARTSAILLGLFATVALILSALGVYGVISFGVAQRNREIGIRTALGAARGDLVRMVVLQGLQLAGAGVVIGLILALAATRVLSSLLFGVAPADPATYLAITGVLIGTALLASWIPARRAAGVQPVDVLKSD